MDEIDFAEPILPYAGTSGWSGSDSSLAAIIAQDKDGRTLTQQRTAFKWVVEAGCFGKTWRELALRTGWHHGSASRTLSILHKEGYIVRLKETRDNCAIYVAPNCVDGREIAQRKVKTCKNCGHKL